MAKIPAILGVHLLEHGQDPVRVGTLTRDAEGSVSFVVSEAYLRDTRRPVLSLGWYNPQSDEQTQKRLAARRDKIGLRGAVPPWFSGLLPEGALRELVLTEMGPGDHDQFDFLTRLGADLTGAVVITPETDAPKSAGPLRLETIGALSAARPEGLVKFSLAGVQLKLTANLAGERLYLPGHGESGRCIIKVAADGYRDLPEAEFGAMQLARMVGVNTAPCQLMPREALSNVPERLLQHGPNVLVVERFDRRADGRVHIEDAAQILGAIDIFKYTMGTTDTVLNMVRRFSTDPRADLSEAFRRVVVDVMLGNGDNHLKNWSFIFPDHGQIRLSPAYDIVPTVLFIPGDELALKFVGTQRFGSVNLHRFERMASYLQLDPKGVLRDVRQTVEAALDLWPTKAPELLGEERGTQIIERLEGLQLVEEIRAS
jgi:serine/threonine-protein kinase HipA